VSRLRNHALNVANYTLASHSPTIGGEGVKEGEVRLGLVAQLAKRKGNPRVRIALFVKGESNQGRANLTLVTSSSLVLTLVTVP
jgi:hypothetical protein